MADRSEVKFIFRPIDQWPDKPTEHPRPSPFGGLGKKSLPYRRLMEMLRREMSMLGVEEAIIQLYVGERDIRLDGLPRVDARPKKPGVIISVEIPDVGWRTFYVDTFDHWHANLQALAVGFEDSRRLERYGFAKNRDQYRGFLALEPARGPLAAGEVLIRHAGLSEEEAEKLGWNRVTRLAVKRTHPDHNSGDSTAYMEVLEAKQVLGI